MSWSSDSRQAFGRCSGGIDARPLAAYIRVHPGAAGRRPGGASSLESVLSDNTRRTYDAQWRIFTGWCAEVSLRSLPAEPLASALVAVLSDAGPSRSEAAALIWGNVQRWEDGSGRITVIRSKTPTPSLRARW